MNNRDLPENKLITLVVCPCAHTEINKQERLQTLMAMRNENEAS
jgi:hypothetical protein